MPQSTQNCDHDAGPIPHALGLFECHSARVEWELRNGLRCHRSPTDLRDAGTYFIRWATLASGIVSSHGKVVRHVASQMADYGCRQQPNVRHLLIALRPGSDVQTISECIATGIPLQHNPRSILRSPDVGEIHDAKHRFRRHDHGSRARRSGYH